MADCVLDASAVLARLRAERGGDVVQARAPDAVISAVNYAEVISKLIDLGVVERSATFSDLNRVDV